MILDDVILDFKKKIFGVFKIPKVLIITFTSLNQAFQRSKNKKLSGRELNPGLQGENLVY